MYRIGLFRPLRARHFLIGSGSPENQLHGHDYRVEWSLAGPTLDNDGFLLDLVAVEGLLDQALADLQDQILNEVESFRGLNPSVERLARVLSDRLMAGRPGWDPDLRLRSSVVTVFESESAWASWSCELDPAENR